MYRYNRMKRVTFILVSLVFCLSTGLAASGLSAPAADKNDRASSAQIPAEAVTAQAFESEDEMDQALSVQAGTDQYWAHGNTLMLESLTPGVSMAHYGFGSEVRVNSAQDGQAFAWVHFSIPTPRLVGGTPAKLTRILISYSGDALIDKVDIWDGATRFVSASAAASGSGVLTVNLQQPANITTGIGVSVRLAARCTTDFCTDERLSLRAAGAEFSR